MIEILETLKTTFPSFISRHIEGSTFVIDFSSLKEELIKQGYDSEELDAGLEVDELVSDIQTALPVYVDINEVDYDTWHVSLQIHYPGES